MEVQEISGASTSRQSLSSQFSGEISHLTENEQRIFKGRLRRKKHTETATRIEFECPAHELPMHAFQGFAALMDEASSTSIYCFRVILNSLRWHFSRNTDGCLEDSALECEKSIAKFLRESYLIHLKDSFIPPNSTKNGKAELALRQRELFSLLRFHLLRDRLVPFDQVNISEYLRFIYFHAGSDRLKNFLDETFCDEFFLELPFYIAAVYDDLGLICPPDIEKYKTIEYDDHAIHEETMANNEDLAARLNDFISSLQADISAPADTGAPSQRTNGALSSTQDTQQSAPRAPRRTKTVVPATPVKKKPNPAPDAMNTSDDDLTVVKQTPISKIRRHTIITSSTSLIARSMQKLNFNGQNDVGTLPTNRKRPNAAAASQGPTKKARLSNGAVSSSAATTVVPTAINLASLFSDPELFNMNC